MYGTYTTSMQQNTHANTRMCKEREYNMMDCHVMQYDVDICTADLFHIFSFVLFSVPHVRIQGSPDIHVNQGSLINLTCIISYSPEPPAFIFWYRGNEVREPSKKCLFVQWVEDIYYANTQFLLVSSIYEMDVWLYGRYDIIVDVVVASGLSIKLIFFLSS